MRWLLVLVAVAILTSSACTSAWRATAGGEHSGLTGGGATVGAAVSMGKTLKDDTALLASAGADLGIVDDDGLETFWSTHVGFDFLYQLPRPQLGFGVGAYVAFVGSPGDRDYIGPGLRLSLFPFVKRRRGTSSSHFSFHRYNLFNAIGLQLDGQYVEARGSALEPRGDDNGFVISLSVVLETSSIHR